jgi:hypothetical protein
MFWDMTWSSLLKSKHCFGGSHINGLQCVTFQEDGTFHTTTLRASNPTSE